jgi:hypothetical protein
MQVRIPRFIISLKDSAGGVSRGEKLFAEFGGAYGAIESYNFLDRQPGRQLQR